MNTFAILGALAVMVAVSAAYAIEGNQQGSELYHHQHHHEDPYKHHEPHPYNFEYKVQDHKTGDHKSHHESLEGGVVKGYYTLNEADGTVREVHYTADKHNGFNAVVKKHGTPVFPQQPVKYHHEEPAQQNHHQHYEHVQKVHEPAKHWQ